MGRYVNRNLLKDEKVLYEAKIHWAYWVGPALGILILIAIGVLIQRYGSESSPVWGYVAIGFYTLAAISYLERLIAYKSTEMVVTNRRLVIKRGFIARTTFELLLQKAETVGVDQQITGRLLGFGRITAIGTGGSHCSLEFISRPMDFRSAFEEAAAAASFAPDGAKHS